jgi:hypothetical protein
MMIGIMTRFSLLKSQVTWRVIKIFAGCRWLKFIHQTAVRIVRCFLKEIPHNARGTLTVEFQPSAACKTLDYATR